MRSLYLFINKISGTFRKIFFKRDRVRNIFDFHLSGVMYDQNALKGRDPSGNFTDILQR